MQTTPTTKKTDSECTDIIADMMQRLAPLLAATPDVAGKLPGIERDLRKTWGGDRVYIAHRRGEVNSALHSERNSRILRAYQQGRHIAWLARTEALSERRVLQIVGTLRPARRPKSMG